MNAGAPACAVMTTAKHERCYCRLMHSLLVHDLQNTLQVGRLRRELERVTEERDKSREEAARADQGRQHLEVELKVRTPGPMAAVVIQPCPVLLVPCRYITFTLAMCTRTCDAWWS
jgi:hypothetical protein